MNKKFIYIYNVKQANHLISNDCKVVEVGLGSKNDVYFKFVRNDNTEIALERWRERVS